ncbi:hypothetical protein IPM65_02750 [Candidatus Roizmanbacteria bacterium]|nr:MAG: hypothetical protein IPM65_02750 [Candidatus Roizmanbacteria bacterium]
MYFQYKNSTGLSDEQIRETSPKLDEYKDKLKSVIQSGTYEAAESSVNLSTDETLLNTVQNLVEKKKTVTLKYIVVIGIGGSNLGTKAIYDAIHGYYDLFEPARFPKMIFLDTQDENVLSKVVPLLSSCSSTEEFLINAISKSGGTTETMTNLEVLSSSLSQKFSDITDRIVFTTDEGSNMHKKATELGFDAILMPKQVGGRFSVLSAVGLFPLALAGFDIVKLRRGAANMRDICGKRAFTEDNPAMISASILYLLSEQGKNINDNFTFLPQLESLGKWYRQLMGESVGKDGKGITPTVSVGSTDLHSVGQLYLGGPKDKITTFIYSREQLTNLAVAENLQYNLVPVIKGKKIHSIMNAIVQGTKIAYKNQGLPFMEIGFEKTDEESLGEFMQFKMIEIMYLGHLMDVNTFDQPHVELYKIETKKILEE